MAAQQSPLKIVVIEGEAGVNIIQQKTAVKPLIEVRDRNNNPVAGAVVTFSIEGGKAATFGGASTLTVATNAAGQAAVSSLTPNIAGAFQIQVSAAFQGQIATAAIAQTNVVTAAEAAAASAAGASSGTAGAGGGGGGAAGGAGGAAGGAGGGLSATTIAVTSAAVAGGVVAAKEVVDKVGGELKFEGSFTGTISGTFTNPFNTCTYSKSVSATARLRFPEHSDSSVNGVFDYEGTETLIASTCPGSFAGGQFIGEVEPLTGSPSSFSGSKVFPGPPTTGQSGETITGQHSYTFQGSINGDTATGTFNYEETSLSQGLNTGSVSQLGKGSFPITFHKVQ
jgi:hypothetical protein